MSKYVKKDLKSLVASLKKETSDSGPKEEKMDRFWRPSLDEKDKASEYVVRVLPTGNDFPWTVLHTHMFKFPNGNFVSFNCPKKHKVGDSKCPLCEELEPIWASENTTKINQIARPRYAKARYMVNVLIVKDPRDGGANEGKVMLYSYGKQIQDIMNEELFDEDEGCIFFDPEDGADLKIKMDWTGSGNEKYPSYLKTKFINKGSRVNLDGEDLDEDAIDKLMEQTIDVEAEYLVEEKFWSYDQIAACLKEQKFVSKKDVANASDGEEVKADEPEVKKEKPKTKKEKVEEPEEDDEPVDLGLDDDDDDDDDDLDDLLNDL